VFCDAASHGAVLSRYRSGMRLERNLSVRWPARLQWGLAAALCLVHPMTVAQSMPLREAPIIEPGDAVTQAAKPALPAGPPNPPSVVQVFLDACVLNEGEPTAVTDWALGKGFEAVDPLQTGAEDLLGGAPGAVLTMPGTGGRVLLASSQDRRCLVWAEQTNGPLLRVALQKMLTGLGSKGARVQSLVDRNLQSAGSWRKQSQWRYRRVGGSEDFSVGSATTLGNTLGAQLLHFAPLAPVAPRNPDGTPSR